MGRNLPNVLVMRWVVRVRNRGLVLWLGGAGGEGKAGLGVGVGVVGPAGAKEEDADRAGLRPHWFRSQDLGYS